MKQRGYTTYWLLAITLCLSSIVFAEPFAKGPYLGQTPPGPVAQVFAPGLICDTRPHRHETYGHFSADGNTFCFRKLGYVYITENTDQGWTTPKRIRNIPYKTWSCCLSPDANTIYFLDQRFIRPAQNRGEPSKHIYQHCIRNSRGWSLPKELGPPFSSAMGGFSLLADNSLCFKSRQGDFCIAPFVGNTWDKAIKLPIEMGNLHGCDPGIAPDGSFLVFYSIRPGAQGGTPTDLYITLRGADGTWTKPHLMGPGVNTEYYEIGARISPDKKYMFFMRSNGWNLNRATDTADIYWVELKDYLRDPNDPNIHQTDAGVDITGSSAEPFAKGPYLGQNPPGPLAQVFAPGLICDTRPHQWETWGSFSADGNSFCFSRNWYVFVTENTDQGWTVPKRVKSIPKWTSYHCISPDANSIYFSYKYDPSKHNGPFRCQRMSDGWSKPQALGPPLLSLAGELGISLAANNNIYISSGRKKAHGKGNIWLAPFVNNTWPRVEHIYLNYPVADMGIAPDESFMVVTAMNMPIGYGLRDLYLSLRLPDGTWSKPKNLGPQINTAHFEYSPRISPDKKYLFFTRANGWGENANRDTGDIYWVELKEYLPESYR